MRAAPLPTILIADMHLATARSSAFRAFGHSRRVSVHARVRLAAGTDRKAGLSAADAESMALDAREQTRDSLLTLVTRQQSKISTMEQRVLQARDALSSCRAAPALLDWQSPSVSKRLR